LVELNHRQRTIKIKIVYYGPAVGGKTTNLQILHQKVEPQHRGEMVSINSAQDRTLLFDLLPVKASGFRGFDLRLQVLAVPGQALYAATRRLVLKGADSLVFVANSAADRWEENVQSFREMTENLLAHQLDPSSLPLVLQYNKRDLPEVTPFEFMDRTLNARKVPSIPAVALRGEGVLETFASVLTATMEDLAVRYQIVDLARGQPLQQWTKQTMLTMFGTTSFTSEAAEGTKPLKAAGGAREKDQDPAEDEGRRTMRIALPEDVVRVAAAGAAVRAQEMLVESYAEAATRLTTELTEMKDERDLSRRRLDDIQIALGAAQDLSAGQPLDATLRLVLGPLATAGRSRFATFLLPEGTRTFRVAALRGVAADPLVRGPVGARYINERFAGETQPRAHHAADALDLGEVLGASEPPFATVAVVPVRTTRRLLGLGLLYYTADDAPPRPDELAHLGSMATALSASLELSSALEATREAERLRAGALLGAAGLRTNEEVLDTLMALRDGLGSLRQGATSSAQREAFGRLTLPLAGALARSRALAALALGAPMREVLEIAEVLAELPQKDADVKTPCPAASVAGDPTLLRLGLLALLSAAGGRQVEARLDNASVKIRVGPVQQPPPASAGDFSQSVYLALAQKVADIHGGSVGREPEGKSAFLTLTLPRQ
jgi:signal recognition particle receptor subunit beta/GAF domain-containing protein